MAKALKQDIGQTKRAYLHMSDPEKHGSKSVILLVDDAPADVRPLSDFLTGRGFDVRLVSSGQSAIQVAGDDPPDIILLDVKMPEMDGYDVCTRLKANGDLSDIPVLFMVGLDEALDKAKGFDVGGADHITKPFEFVEVLARVEAHLKFARTKIQLEQTTGQLEAAHKVSEQLYADLEGQVRQRTAELEDANNALREIKAQFEAVYNHHYQLTGLIDRDGRLLMGNKTALKMAGIDAQEVVGKLFWETPWWTHSQEVQRTLREAIERAMRGEMVQFDTTHVSATGETRYIDFRIGPLFDDDGKVIYLVPEGYDITERKQAVEALRQSRERLHQIVNNAVVGIYQVTNKGKFLLVNRKFAQMFGYTSPEAFLASVENIDQLYVDPNERPSILADINTRGYVDDAEIRFWKRDGQIILVRVSVRVIQDDDQGRIYEGVMADITVQKQAEQALRDSEEKLARSKKMESLGLLAGGVAHDLNNILSGVIAYPELLLMDLPAESKLREPIKVIQESGHRAVAIVQDLLTVARGVAITKEPMNLNDVVADYLHSPEFKELEQMHPTVNIKTDLDSELLNISGSSVHIRKAVMNLLSNATEAASGGGQVTISTANRYMDRPLRGYDDVTVGEYVVLAVSDDGSGIAPDDLQRIFEPFYTKKVMGRSGTGLGLAVVWNTVQDHKGYIDVTSGETGTTFELYFPMTRDEIAEQHSSIPIDDYKGNGETILVVDDVESQRDITCRMLDTLGYQTRVASSGEKAVAYLKNHTVDLLLLDMIMDPGINGRQTYEQIIKIHPNQKAVIISGFAETDEVKKTQKLGAGKYVRKPFGLARIGLAVKEALAT